MCRCYSLLFVAIATLKFGQTFVFSGVVEARHYKMQPLEQNPDPAAVNLEEGRDFEGDIILRPDQDFAGKDADKIIKMLWPDGVLYYNFSDEFNEKQKSLIERALSDLQQETCVRFVRRTEEPTYIHVRNTKRGCAAQVGFHPTGQGIDLYLSSPGCLRSGTIQHEFLHALGFWHEHSRPDRDKYITIYWNKIMPGREMNFKARTQFQPQEYLPYDYNSVMHYRAVAFSKDRLTATIVPKDHKAFFAIGQRVRFSPLDLAKLNVLYKCGPEYYKGEDIMTPPGVEEETLEKEFTSTEDGLTEENVSLSPTFHIPK